MVKHLQILMNGERVGRFSRYANGQHRLQYAPEWLASPYARPLSLSLPLQEKAIESEAVINYFDNLLPDNADIRQRIAARFQSATTLPFDLLSSIGRDAAGAITLLPEDADIPDHQTMHLQALNESEMADLFNGYRQHSPLGMSVSTPDFRISIAGAQEKTALTFWQGQWHLPQGITPTTHIIKLPIGEIQTAQHRIDLSQSVDNEWLCLALLAQLGLPTASAEILSCQHLRALAVARFDRKISPDGRYLLRLPFEDACQSFGLPPSLKYESDGGLDIKKMVQERLVFSQNQQDIYRFMQTQVAFFLLAAIDGHAKNFSFQLQAGGRFSLSPIYDVISAYPLLGGQGWHEKDLRLAMSLRSTKQGKKWHWYSISAKHYLATAKYIGFPQTDMEKIIEEMKVAMPRALDSVVNQSSIPIAENVRERIFSGVRNALRRL